MNFAYLGLGSNLDNPYQQLSNALEEINALKGISIKEQSSLYLTAPIGPAQPDFLNMVISIETSLSPLILLEHLQSIEEKHHRKRIIHWGPRTLDIDILLYNDQIITEGEKLIIPHPRMHERGFVLIPLQEIAPQITLPHTQHSLQTYITQIDHLDDIHKLEITDENHHFS